MLRGQVAPRQFHTPAAVSARKEPWSGSECDGKEEDFWPFR
jgi:hypothetical protein